MAVLDPELLGTRLRELRTKRGLTQEHVAHPRYTPAYVSTVEAGRRFPSDEAIRHFADRLGVDEDELKSGRPTNLLPELELQLQQGRSLISSGDLEEAQRIFRSALNKAKRYKVAFQQAKAHEGLALCLERSSQLREATDEYVRAQRILAAEPPNVRADAVAGEARCWHLRGDKHHAIYLLETLLHSLVQQTLEDPDALIRIYTSLSIVYVEGDFLKKAADAAENALQLEVHVSDPARLAAMHNMVARVLMGRGEVKQAQQSLDKSERFYKLADLELEVGRVHLAKGIFLLRRGSPKKAAQELSKALETFVRTKSPLDEARACTELGRIARINGETSEALSFLDRALGLLDGAEPAQVARAVREKALADVSATKAKREKELRRAAALFEEAGEPVQAAMTYAYLGDLLGGESRCRVYRDGLEILTQTHVS